MNAKYDNFGFYTVDTAYLKYLNEAEPEVYFSTASDYRRKPFLGIVVMINGYSYFIPLSSRNAKHTAWKSRSNEHFLIYEIVSKDTLRDTDVFKPHSNTEVKKLLAVVDLKKMVPVPDNLYSRINFATLADERYRSLLRKEYEFRLEIKDDILNNADMIYTRQAESKKVYPFYCNFSKLEKLCDEYTQK